MPDRTICVVFGGSGFLGQRLCRHLLDAGYQVRSVSRTGPPGGQACSWWSNVQWVAADLGTELANATLVGAEFAFHLACSTYPSTSNSDLVFDLESNLVASVRMLKAAAECGVRRLIFVSSGGTVYGIPRFCPIPESHPTDPICSYGIHKLAIEKYLHLFRVLSHLDSMVLRVSNIYGECQSLDRPLGAVSHFASKAIAGDQIEIWGDGTLRRDFIHVDNVVDALEKCIHYEGHTHTFNIGSGSSVSLNELLARIQRRSSRELKVCYQPERSFDVHDNVLDITRAVEELGWTPSIDLETGLDRLFAYGAKRFA